MIKAIPALISLLLITGCVNNTTEKQPTEIKILSGDSETKTIYLDDFWTEFCSNPADIQKTELIKKCKANDGSYIIAEGEVFEVRKQGTETHLLVSHCAGGLNPQADITMYAEQEEETMKLKKGDRVKYKAQQKDCGNFALFYTGITAKKGMILKE